MYVFSVSGKYGVLYWNITFHQPGLSSLNGKTSYRQLSWNIEAARLGVIVIVSL